MDTWPVHGLSINPTFDACDGDCPTQYPIELDDPTLASCLDQIEDNDLVRNKDIIKCENLSH